MLDLPLRQAADQRAHARSVSRRCADQADRLAGAFAPGVAGRLLALQLDDDDAADGRAAGGFRA